MISDFSSLSQKISQLAEMAQSLRRENSDLRVTLAELSAENADLAARMDAAHHRVQSLLAQIPEVDDLPPGDDGDDDEEEAA